MNKTWLKDFLREIKKSLNRYLSIFFIVALGVAFFTGVRSSEPDMRLTADKYLDDKNFMDIRVISTLGLTGDDIEALAKINGVDCAEGGYEKDVFTDIDNSEKVIHVMSITQDINEAYITAGQMPEKPGECIADVKLAESFGFEIGDTITLRGAGDENISDVLENDTYTICGFAMSPFYLTFQRGSAAIGDGNISAFIMIDAEEFIQDYYNQVYIRSDDLKTLNSYSDEYTEVLGMLEEKVKALSEERCQARYDSVYAEAERKLLDGEKEYEEASREAEAKLEAAGKEIESAEQELSDGNKQLESARSEIESAQAELSSGESRIENGSLEIASKEQELKNAGEQIEQGEQELNAVFEQLQSAQQEYNAGIKALADAKVQYANGLVEYNNGNAELEKQKLLLDATALLLKAGWEAYEKGYGDYDTLMSIQAEYDSGLQKYNEGAAKLLAAKTRLDDAAKQISDNEAFLEAARQELDNGWQQYNAARSELSKARSEADNGKVQLEAAKEQLKNSESLISEGRSELSAAKQQYEDSQKQLTEGSAKLEAAKAEYDKAVKEADEKLEDARKELDEGWQELSKLDLPEWYVLDRSTIQTYVEYGTDAERMGAIGKVFPVIFFLVAALVCLTTMTRMVEEQRTQIGTFKALGYSTFTIALKYLLYALTASVGGSILGAAAGGKLIPKVIIEAYGMLYSNIPYLVIPINIKYSVMASLAAILCTTAAAVAACYRALGSQAAQLMRPAAPKQGKKILIERITPLWKKLNFSQKSTLRNLFRYKKRLFMTIFGIGACTALLLVGFGLRDGISAILDNQFEKVWLYDATVVINTEASDEDKEELEQIINENKYIGGSLTAYMATMDAEHNGTVKSVNLFVPENTEDFRDTISLHDRITGEEYLLGDEEVIISEKLSKLLDLSVGDTINISESDTSSVSVRVGAIAESYIYHYIYMSPVLYENVFGEAPQYNQILLNAAQGAAASDLPVEELLAGGAVSGVSMVADILETMDQMMSSLDAVVWVLIVSAGLLAFVVLYNLNNISITERIRELATIKVLGFYNIEVAGYVYRENILLTMIGIAAGVVLGRFLHRFVLLTAEIDIIMFGRDISVPSYIMGILLTIVFAAAVNYVMYFRLKKIDMIESLKSVE